MHTAAPGPMRPSTSNQNRRQRLRYGPQIPLPGSGVLRRPTPQRFADQLEMSQLIQDSIDSLQERSDYFDDLDAIEDRIQQLKELRQKKKELEGAMCRR
jgi:hypothetical protein